MSPRSQNTPPDASSDSEYLKKLEFDPELRKSAFNFFVTRPRVILLLITAISIWGLWSFFQLPRESSPEIKIPIGIVVTPFPGASPSDVEELVTKKIETKISGLSGIKKITSNSANSLSSVTVEYEASEPIDDAIRNLRDAVSEVKTDLPDDAEDPSVKEISFDDQPILTIALSGPLDGLALRSIADTASDELKKIPGVREVHVSGGDEREFSVAYDPTKLSAFGISPDEANRAIALTNRAIPAGSFDGTRFSYPIRTDARFFTAETLGNIPIRFSTNGAAVLLKDIATVEERAIKRTVLSRLSLAGSEPESAVTLDIVKRTGGSIIETVDEAEATMDRLSASFPGGVKWTTTVDLAKEIRKNFDELTRDFFLTVGLVVGTLILIVGLKEAIIAGLTIPLVFFITFGTMLLSGTSLNFLSLFSLLLSMGLLVDDAIVVVSATKQYLRTGKFTPEEAVLLVLRDFKVVLTTTTLTTMWAFLPLLLATGMIGQFIKSIPITVSVTLTASLGIALMINHPLAAALERIRFTKNWFVIAMLLLLVLGISGALFGNLWGFALAAVSFIIMIRLALWYFLREGNVVLTRNSLLVDSEWNDENLIKSRLKEAGNRENGSFKDRLIHGIIHFDRIIPPYERLLRSVLSSTRRKWIVLLGTGALFVSAVLLPVFGIVPVEFFPASDEELIFINIEAPIGLKLNETDTLVQRIEHKLLAYPEIVNFSTVVGNAGVSQDGTGSTGGNASHLAGIVIKLSDKHDRTRTSSTIADALRNDFSDIRDADIRVASQQGGPPSGSAFEARISGDDLKTIDGIVHDLKGILAAIPGTTNINSSLKSAPADYTFSLDHDRLAFYGLDATSVGSTLRMAISGTEVTTVLRDNKEISVNARFSEQSMPSLDDVRGIEFHNASGAVIRLGDIATVELKPSVDSITRIDQKRTALLSAGVNADVRPASVLATFQKKVKDDYHLPSGYSITYGGENEQNQESVASILRALVIAIALIIATLIIQFNSIKQAAIVLTTLPLALIGVFVGMAIFRVSLSFPGLIGILALFGIVVKNAIILIDKMNLNWASGLEYAEAIIDAGKSRIEAIFITSFATILGLIPITLSDALWRALGTAIIFGLAVSSFFTLLIVPVLSSLFIKKKSRA